MVPWRVMLVVELLLSSKEVSDDRNEESGGSIVLRQLCTEGEEG